jgi:hypothetical protein
MWQGYVPALALYNKYICEEWIRRGYKDTILERMRPYTNGVSHIYLPEWLEDPAVAASHRSKIIRKDYIHYSQFGWEEPDDIPYVWPV